MSVNKQFEEWKAKAKMMGIYDDFKISCKTISPLDMKYFDNNRYGIYSDCKINILEKYVGNSRIVYIPPVDKIANDAFASCKTIEKIIVGETVKTIGSNVFHDCINLDTVEIKAKLTAISSSCFFGCKKLTNINIPETVKIIHFNAFTSCEQLKTIKLPDGLLRLDSGVFSNSGLESIIIPESTYLLGSNILNNCNNLKEIEIKSIDLDRMNGLGPSGYIITDGCIELKNVKVRYYLADLVAKHIRKKNINIIKFGYSNK